MPNIESFNKGKTYFEVLEVDVERLHWLNPPVFNVSVLLEEDIPKLANLDHNEMPFDATAYVGPVSERMPLMSKLPRQQYNRRRKGRCRGPVPPMCYFRGLGRCYRCLGVERSRCPMSSIIQGALGDVVRDLR
ncbi:hypothetical protein Adt_02365 [Abeliophyllum distichum]|uniref:Uncharacterized protein n=1 Tax=Abeliophyllum distichum TaxID=126358 RepID=A0ABD1VVQ8_9LAMI